MKDPLHKLYEEINADNVKEVISYRRPPRRFRASEAADCSRKLWYRLSGYRPVPRKARLSLVANSGNVHHDYVRQLLALYGIELTGLVMNADGSVTEAGNVVREYTHNGATFVVSGRSDGGIVVQDPDADATLELKSCGFWTFKYTCKAYGEGGNDGALAYLMEKKPNYVYQGTTMAMLQEKEWVYLLLVNRDNMQIGVYAEQIQEEVPGNGLLFKVDPALVKRILGKFAVVSKAVDSGVAPDPEYRDGSVQCNQCDFLVYCHTARKRKERGAEPYVLFPVDGVLEAPK